MQVLERILEELDRLEEPYFVGYIDKYKVKEIIINHLNDNPNTNVREKRLIDANVLDEEVMNFFLTITGNPCQAAVARECKKSFRRIIDEQPTIYANDDGGWIPCSERLPEEPPEEVDDEDNFEEYIVMIEGAERPTILRYAGDGTWWEEGTYYKVIAWQPLPALYKGEEAAG